jgi:RNA polymerase sigma-70 factor (ECF subfamily)
MSSQAHGQSDRESAGQPAAAEDLAFVAALRRGDESAFVLLLGQYQASLVRLALLYVGQQAVAEEVAQETWVVVLEGIGRFEGRSSLRTWIYSILLNRARTRGKRESRSVPFSALAAAEAETAELAVAPERFQTSGRDVGHWTAALPSWGPAPEEQLLTQETQAHLRAGIAALPPAQQTVITLRDVEGWTAAEVCNVLGITETNQRVLLHRARSRVRRTLEAYFAHQQTGPAA